MLTTAPAVLAGLGVAGAAFAGAFASVAIVVDLAQRAGQVAPARLILAGVAVATGAGVSAGIDMALTLAGRIAGNDEAQTVQLIIEYAPESPYTAGSPETAPAAVVERAVRMMSS